MWLRDVLLELLNFFLLGGQLGGEGLLQGLWHSMCQYSYSDCMGSIRRTVDFPEEYARTPLKATFLQEAWLVVREERRAEEPSRIEAAIEADEKTSLNGKNQGGW